MRYVIVNVERKKKKTRLLVCASEFLFTVGGLLTKRVARVKPGQMF